MRGAAEHYASTVNIITPGRSDILSLISRLATDGSPISPMVLDLGSGLGDVTSSVLALRPGAIMRQIDFSDEMIEMSQRRFANNPNVEIVKHDLNRGLPVSLKDSRFDSVVSCFALHHIEVGCRIGLYRDIHELLREGGLFVNGDLFKCESPSIDRWEFDAWIRWLAVQLREEGGEDWDFEELRNDRLRNMARMGDKPGTIWEMREDMLGAGFRSVDCLWKNQNLAVMVAMK